MGKYFYRLVVLILFTCIGLGVLGTGEGYADPGFEIPRVDDHFDPVKQGPAPQKTNPVNQNAPEEGNTWDWIKEKASGAWEWTRETVSDAWEWTKETALDFWDWFVEVLSKITEVVVDALSAAWDWIVDNYEYIVSGIVLIVGIVLCFFAPPAGAAILSGWAMSFGISFALNGWKIDETTWLDAAFGGVLGLFGLGFAGGAARVLATGLGRKLVTGLANARVLGPLLKSGGKLISKLPQPLQKIFSKAGFIGSVEGAGTSIVDDLLHGREINWKNALISGFGGALLVGMGSFIAPKIDPFVDKVTTAVKEYTRPVVAKVSPVVQKLDDFDIKKCFSYQKPPGYSASIFLPSFDLKDCIYSADGGGGGGSSQLVDPNNPSPRIQQLRSVRWNDPTFRGPDNEGNLIREFNRLNIELEDIPHIQNRLTSNQKGVLGEYFMDKRMTSIGYQKLPSKTGGRRNNGADGLYIRRNDQGDITSIVIVEAKWNTAGYGYATYVNPNSGSRQRARQMSYEWIDQKARDMIRQADPATREAGRMLDSALNNRRYRGPLNPNGQRLSSTIIDARGYKVKQDHNGRWIEEWEHDPQGSGLQDNNAIWPIRRN